MSIDAKVQAAKDEHGVELEVNGDLVKYPGNEIVNGPGAGIRRFTAADLAEGVFESWFEAAHAAAQERTRERPRRTETPDQ
jgi:hypothetical protein